jgi:hypothetical protein
MQEQLDRIEQKVDCLTTVVNEHVGFIAAFKWLVGGLAAGFLTLLGYIGLKGHS